MTVCNSVERLRPKGIYVMPPSASKKMIRDARNKIHRSVQRNKTIERANMNVIPLQLYPKLNDRIAAAEGGLKDQLRISPAFNTTKGSDS